MDTERVDSRNDQHERSFEMDGTNIEITEVQFSVIRAALRFLSDSEADFTYLWPELFAGFGSIPAPTQFCESWKTLPSHRDGNFKCITLV